MTTTVPLPSPAPRGGEARRAARRNQNGQAMGPKGLKTQRRLIDATVTLLATTPLRDLRVAEIAREAETSPATFYLYFGDVSDVVLAGIAELSQSTPELLAIARSDWSHDTRASARALVESYMRFWDSHRTLFRVRNLAAEEGDPRFRLAREQSIRPLLEALANQVELARSAGRIADDLHAASVAGALLAMLERLSAIGGTQSRENGITPERILTATVHAIAASLGVASA